MTRSRLRNKYLKEKSADSKIAYDKQRNYCLNLLRRTKKNYFANINISSITDNKKFRKTVKPLFSDKTYHKETINSVKNDTILSDDQVVADKFNNYFNNIVENLLTLTNKNFPKEKTNGFCFEYTYLDQTLKKLGKLNPKKASQVNDIPVKVIKENKEIVTFVIHHNFKNS